MKKINTRAMIEGALLAALTAIMGIFYNIPFLNVLTFFWPVPIIIIGYRHGFKVSIISAVVAAVIVSWITTPITGLILLFTYALPGAVMGMLMRRKVNIYLSLLICGLILAIAAVFEFILGLQLIEGKNFFEIISNFSTIINDLYVQFYNQFINAVSILKLLGFGDATIKKVIEYFDAMMKMIKLVIPSSIILSGVIAAYINFKVVKLVLNRIGYYIEDIKRFPEWKLDGNAKVVMLGLTIAILVMMIYKVEALYYIYINMWVVLMMVYAVLGLSVVAYYIEEPGSKYEIPRPLQRIALVTILLFFVSILAYIGIFDMTADLRRLNKNTIGGVK